MNKKVIIGLFLVAVFAVFIMINTKWSGESKEQVVIKISDVKCNAQKKVCKIELEGLNIELSFDNNIYYLKPFNVFVWTEAKTHIKSIQVDFKMINMNMGVNRFSLRKTELENEKQKWQGKALLPVCVTGRADWFAELGIVTENVKYIISLPVSVQTAN